MRPRFFKDKNKTIYMKRLKIRDDLMNKSEYSKAFRVGRNKLDKMINDGELSVERISGVDYIKIK